MKSQYAKGNKPIILHITSLKNVPTLLFSLWNSTAVRLTVVAFPDLSQDVGLSFWGTGPILSLWNSFCVRPYSVPLCRHQPWNGGKSESSHAIFTLRTPEHTELFCAKYGEPLPHREISPLSWSYCVIGSSCWQQNVGWVLGSEQTLLRDEVWQSFTLPWLYPFLCFYWIFLP